MSVTNLCVVQSFFKVILMPLEDQHMSPTVSRK